MKSNGMEPGKDYCHKVWNGELLLWEETESFSSFVHKMKVEGANEARW